LIDQLETAVRESAPLAVYGPKNEALAAFRMGKAIFTVPSDIYLSDRAANTFALLLLLTMAIRHSGPGHAKQSKSS